ncbi:MAG: ABC transporter permease [Bacteroidota bacterium]
MLQRIWAITQKEFITTFRDRGTLFIILLMPLIQLVLFAYGIRTDVKHISMVVADQSLDQASRSYIEDLVQSGYFDIVEAVPDQDQAIDRIDQGEAKLGVVIPAGFSEQLNEHDASILFIVDGSDPFTTQSAYSAANLIAQQHSVQLILQDLSRLGQGPSGLSLTPLNAHIRILYNPDLIDLWFFVPGMIAMLLQIQTIILTALAVVREREVGTIEQVLVTPIRPVELMLGKTLPYLLLAVINLLTIILMGTLWFGVPFRGDFVLFFWLVLLYIISGLGLGLLISSISQNQQQAQQLAMMTMLLGLIISGFVFPHYSMPLLLRLLSYIFPLTAFIPISRGIFMKGIGLPFLTNQVLFLVVYDVVILIVAARLFRRTLD